MEERTAESEHIIATLVSNLDPQPSKDDAQRVVCNGSDEELQLQLAEVRMYVHAYIRTQGEGRGPVWRGCGRVLCIHTHTVHTYVCTYCSEFNCCEQFMFIACNYVLCLCVNSPCCCNVPNLVNCQFVCVFSIYMCNVSMSNCSCAPCGKCLPCVGEKLNSSPVSCSMSVNWGWAEPHGIHYSMYVHMRCVCTVCTCARTYICIYVLMCVAPFSHLTM